jgi:hypothetical protein
MNPTAGDADRPASSSSEDEDEYHDFPIETELRVIGGMPGMYVDDDDDDEDDEGDEEDGNWEDEVDEDEDDDEYILQGEEDDDDDDEDEANGFAEHVTALLRGTYTHFTSPRQRYILKATKTAKEAMAVYSHERSS